MKDKKQQTVVEFLELCFIRNASISLDEWKTARQMFEQQIVQSFNAGQMKEAKEEFWTKGYEYYNDTYGEQ